FHFAYSLLHLLAGLERDHELLWHKDFIASARVARLASRPSLHLEDPKIPQLDAVVLDERFDDGVEGLLDDFLGLELSQPDLLGDRFDNLFLGHVTSPLREWPVWASRTALRGAKHVPS